MYSLMCTGIPTDIQYTTPDNLRAPRNEGTHTYIHTVHTQWLWRKLSELPGWNWLPLIFSWVCSFNAMWIYIAALSQEFCAANLNSLTWPVIIKIKKVSDLFLPQLWINYHLIRSISEIQKAQTEWLKQIPYLKS